MNTDIQTLKQILSRILRAEPDNKVQAVLLDKSYAGIKSAVDTLEQYQAQHSQVKRSPLVTRAGGFALPASH